MASAFTNLPSQRTGPSITPRNIFNTIGVNTGPRYNASGITLDGVTCRDTGNNPTSVLRAGLILGKQTSSVNGGTVGFYSDSILGVTTAPLGDAQTTLVISTQAAVELARRIGTSGTLTLTGPTYSGASNTRQVAVTYSAVNTSNGQITITATGSGSVSGVNAVEALPFVDSTGSGTFKLTIEGVTTGAITYSATAATLYANINTALNATFGTSAIVASGASLAAIILTFSGTGYAARPIQNSSNGTVSGVKVIATLLTGATGFTAGNNPTSSGVGAALAGGSTTTTAGVTAVTGIGGEFPIGSLVGAADGSQIPVTIFSDGEYSITDLNDLNNNNQNQGLMRFLAGGDMYGPNIVNFVTADDFGNVIEPSCTVWLAQQLNGAAGVNTAAVGNTFNFSNFR